MKAAAHRIELPDLAPPWPGYRGPDAAAVGALHRHPANVVLASNADGKGFRHLCAMPVSDLQPLFPVLADVLSEDVYMSVHGMGKTGPGTVALGDVQGLARALRKSDNAERLTAAFLDCDAHTVGKTPGQALGILSDAERAGVLPPVTAYLESGRGIWPFWLLGDADGRVPRAGNRERGLWGGIERALRDRAVPLGIGVDSGAIDLARVCRIPGSVNSKAGETVRYLWVSDTDGRVPCWTLDALADWLGVSSWVPRAFDGGLSLPMAGARRVSGNARGWAALWERRLERLDALQHLRGERWLPGHRNNALFLLAVCLKKTGQHWNAIADAVVRAGLASGLSLAESETVVRDIGRLDKYTRFKDSTIAEWLGVTALELAALGWIIRAGQSAADRAARRAAPDNRDALEAATMAARRELVARFARDAVGLWGIRDLQAWLDGKGHPAAHRTLYLDLAALGIETPRQRANRAQGELALGRGDTKGHLHGNG